MSMAQELQTARDLGARLRTVEQGREAINLAGRTLRKAVNALSGFAWPDVALGVSRAYVSRLEQQINRLATLRTRIAAQPWTRAQADAIGLALVQAAQVLTDVRTDVKLSQAEGSIGSLAAEFARALRVILEGMALAVPWWGWAVVAWLITDRGDPAPSQRGRTTPSRGRRMRARTP